MSSIPLPSSPEETTVAQPAPHVLLVEDDACTAMLFKHLLQKAGYRVTHCADGQAALDLVPREKFDAVVLDLMMPRVDGIQVLKALRIAPANPLVPVIIMSSVRLKVVEDEALRFGAKLYLDKTQTAEMLEALRKIMAERASVTGLTLQMAPLTPIKQAARAPESSAAAPETSPSEPRAATRRFFRF
jgi:CheY-like chemotaxis protein